MHHWLRGMYTPVSIRAVDCIDICSFWLGHVVFCRYCIMAFTVCAAMASAVSAIKAFATY